LIQIKLTFLQSERLGGPSGFIAQLFYEDCMTVRWSLLRLKATQLELCDAPKAANQMQRKYQNTFTQDAELKEVMAHEFF
jgi:hypothetical protein